MSGSGVVRRARGFGHASLTLLAALLPFEMSEPIARVGPLQISSVEVLLYLALAAWGISLVAGWLGGDRDLRAWLRCAPEAHRAVLVWSLVLVASAVCAPAWRGTAIKFALRSLSGILLYAAAADLLRDPLAITRTAKALVAGALVAAIAMIAEGRLAFVAALLRPFHTQTFEVFGLVRGSGPFQYPNIAAMYLEGVLPVAFALGLPSIADGTQAATSVDLVARRFRLGGLAMVILALLAGILVTASRAGLATTFVCLGAMGIFWARAVQTRGAALAAFGALALLGIGSGLSSSELTLRLAFWKDADWYRASIQPVAGPAGQLPAWLAPHSEAAVTFEVRNLGALTWQHLPPTPVVLSYHWLDADSGNVVVFDGLRTELPDDVAPGGGATVRAIVHAPDRPGRYLLWWDLVHEHATWFSQRGSPGLREAVEVRRPALARGPAVAGAGPRPAKAAPLAPGEVIPRRVLWRAAFAAWRDRPLLGLGPDNFRHLYGRYLGLAAPDDRLHANSLYLETLASLGTAGLLALVLLVVAFARAARRAAAAPATRTLALGFGVGLGAYLVHGAFDTFFEFTPTFALAWLLGGAVVALGRPPGEPAT
jgi:O-Antigen ligase